jgi:ABC-type multidrug transport system fused ATPase/permease subunit
MRLSEKWFHRALWLIAFIFAGFLIGLGGLVVGNLPGVEAPPTLESLLDPTASAAARASVQQARSAQHLSELAKNTATQELQAAQARYANARETFNTWLATRTATGRTSQDNDLVTRTAALEELNGNVRSALKIVDSAEQEGTRAEQILNAADTANDALLSHAQEKLDALQRSIDTKNFLIRLALTLPLLVIAGWLFAKHRKNRYWPFVWGFIFFALFAFFVELVPYLPDYGGYVRYIVGVIVTVLAGRYAINSLQRYLQNQKSAETLPENQRRQALSYDVAQSRLAKGVCPGCERKADLTNPKVDFCMHCGISLFDACNFCQTRKNAFARFCPTCGKEPVAS